MKLTDLLHVQRANILMSGNPLRLTRAFLVAWSEEGRRIIMEEPPFPVGGLGDSVFIGDPSSVRGFDVYVLFNPISQRREELYPLLEERPGVVLLYEQRYVGASINRYRIRKFLDYIVAYRRETVGTETVLLGRLRDGKIEESKVLVRRS
ncbi:hypothetical protein [Thermococcus sp.]